MAKTFKSLLGDDKTNTRTMLHEAIPITGTISSGTYNAAGTETNIKTFSHGMFESVYDYPYLSSSANQIFDVTFGYSTGTFAATNAQNSKKINIYNQMAQVLMGYDVSGSADFYNIADIGITISRVEDGQSLMTNWKSRFPHFGKTGSNIIDFDLATGSYSDPLSGHQGSLGSGDGWTPLEDKVDEYF